MRFCLSHKGRLLFSIGRPRNPVWLLGQTYCKSSAAEGCWNLNHQRHFRPFLNYMLKFYTITQLSVNFGDLSYPFRRIFFSRLAVIIFTSWLRYTWAGPRLRHWVNIAARHSSWLQYFQEEDNLLCNRQ